MKPLRDLVLIKVDEVKSKTETGLFIQEDWKSLPLTGEVVAIGPQVALVKKGDKVSFERFSSVIFPDNQRLCKEGHIFACLRN